MTPSRRSQLISTLLLASSGVVLSAAASSHRYLRSGTFIQAAVDDNSSGDNIPDIKDTRRRILSATATDNNKSLPWEEDESSTSSGDNIPTLADARRLQEAVAAEEEAVDGGIGLTQLIDRKPNKKAKKGFLVCAALKSLPAMLLHTRGWQHIEGDDEDLPVGWGADDEDGSSIAPSDELRQGLQTGSSYLQPPPLSFQRRPLPSLFTNACAEAATFLPGSSSASSASKPPKLPNHHRPAWTIQDAIPRIRQRARSMDVNGTQRASQTAADEVSEAEAAHSEGSRQMRNVLQQLRVDKKKGAPLEDTLEKLNALQKQVRALRVQLPVEPLDSSRRGRRSCSGTPSHARRASDTKGACTLPPLPTERRRSASAPSRGEGLRERQQLQQQ